MRKDEVNYKAIGARGQSEDEFLYFIQTKESMLKSQKQHDSNLNTLLDAEEDLIIRETALEPDYTQA